MMSQVKWAVLGVLTFVAADTATAWQTPDTLYAPVVGDPEFQAGLGPRVVIDAAHSNFHTAEGGYAPFAKLLRLDGYRVESNHAVFTAEALARADVLVIANAMHKDSEADWDPLPNSSAFTDAEIAEVDAWVRQGGALLLIADHMPLAGHAERLAAVFGVRFYNGFAVDRTGSGTLTFRRSNGSLVPGVVANGRDSGERIDSVTTFTGQAFRLDPGIEAQPLLIIRDDASQLLLPEVAFRFSDRTPRVPAVNLLQGALVYHGRGRVAVFGEAAFLSAQRGGPDNRPVGMNAPEASENHLFALNVLHWLSRVLK